MSRLDDGVRPPTAAEKLIFRWDSSASSGFDDSCFRMLFDGDNRSEAHRYLRAVDEVRRTSIKRRDSFGSNGTGGIARSASVALQAAMTRLEEEFRHILFTRANPVEFDSPFADFASLSLRSSSVDLSEGSVGGEAASLSSVFRRGRSNRASAAATDDDDDGQAYGGGEEEEEEPGDEQEQPPLEATGSSSSGGGTIRRYGSVVLAEIDLFPPDAVADLRSIAEQMVAAGYVRECFQAYTSARRAALETALQKLGTARFAQGDVHRLAWESVEINIRRWIPVARICVRVIFASERKFCDLIFDGLSLEADADEEGMQQQQQLHHNRRRSTSRSNSSNWTPENPFLDAVKGAVNQLFSFADAISTGPRSTEKLFKILDLHDTLKELLPDIEYIFRGSDNGLNSSFPSASLDSIISDATEILSRLADAIRGILTDFESAIHHEVSPRTVPGGNLHPITRYVMNYITLITEYKQSLDQLIVSMPSPSNLRPPPGNPHAHPPPPPEVDFRTPENPSPLSAHLMWIIAILDANLEAQSHMYRDPALASIFVLNNAHYIVNKVRGSPGMSELIADEFLRRLKGRYLQAATAYQRAAWGRVLHCLREEGLHSSGPLTSGISKNTLRERFRQFNTVFEETHRTQSTWSVPDPQLKQELRISIGDRLVPAYRAFLGRYGPIIEGGRHSELYLKYTVEQLEIALEDFFEGNSPPSRRGH